MPTLAIPPLAMMPPIFTFPDTNHLLALVSTHSTPADDTGLLQEPSDPWLHTWLTTNKQQSRYALAVPHQSLPG
jgi:hypothetical protein